LTETTSNFSVAAARGEVGVCAGDCVAAITSAAITAVPIGLMRFIDPPEGAVTECGSRVSMVGSKKQRLAVTRLTTLTALTATCTLFVSPFTFFSLKRKRNKQIAGSRVSERHPRHSQERLRIGGGEAVTLWSWLRTMGGF
jgi:hypothetical protein